MFDFAGVFKGGVHVPVAMGIRDALDGHGGGRSQRQGRPGVLYQQDLILLTGGLPCILDGLPLADTPLEQPEPQRCDGRGDAQQGEQAPTESSITIGSALPYSLASVQP